MRFNSQFCLAVVLLVCSYVHARCPDSYRSVGGLCLKGFTDRKNWIDAQQECRKDNNGYLANVLSQKDQDAVKVISDSIKEECVVETEPVCRYAYGMFPLEPPKKLKIPQKVEKNNENLRFRRTFICRAFKTGCVPGENATAYIGGLVRNNYPYFFNPGPEESFDPDNFDYPITNTNAYTNWGYRNPYNILDGNKCIQLYETGEWNEVDCNKDFCFICQADHI